ncbi:protein-lysine methyltransferase METTL21E isoform X2 [Callorhinchus milii]|uniref:Methyltransferase 21C, AARS1 lysine n=2 Tax=Callorhinchus milii TaxID=7868 RepID=V9KV58_CALMI|nr:protein-lysine methyltransferase METTL21E isoform X2 [Callorhinchus milii]|eukprot:gi/632948703/ref/XP_007889749.1/ PREDICTED: protein-lysine methyltransferase METTL21C isoform X2 [Callorhinchus milii]
METVSITDNLPAESKKECNIEEQEEEQSESDSETESTGGNQEMLTEEKAPEIVQPHRTNYFFTSIPREYFTFVGYEISIQESIESYGAFTWPGAVDLCHFLENNWTEFNFNDKHVLELGSGTGLLSIVAAILGAYVTATDMSELLGNLQVNLMRNTRGRSKHPPQVKELAWNVDLDKKFPRSVHHYDYILASDVIYHHDYLNDLMATFEHFCHPDSVILLAYKLRFDSDHAFFEKFKKLFNTTTLAEISSSGVRIVKATKKVE